MSVEEEARKANLKFWQVGDDLSRSDEEAEEDADDEVGEEAEEGAADEVDSDPESEYDFEAEEAEDGDNAGSSNGDEEDDTSSHGGGDRMDIGGSDAAAKKKKKKERQDRTPPVLVTKLEEFTYVKTSGQPVEPAKLGAGYGLQLGCIMRESMSINQKNIRAKSNTRLRELLIEKLYNRYQFPEPFNNKKLKGNKVNKLALTRMSIALSSWKSQVKKMIPTGKS
jgi:hypothetical protein